MSVLPRTFELGHHSAVGRLQKKVESQTSESQQEKTIKIDSEFVHVHAEMKKAIAGIAHTNE